jgi:replicative DNA helicase
MSLPANLDAERAFLSSALQNPSILDIHADHLKPTLFHHPAHKTLFKGLLALWKEGKSVDLITISEWLEVNNSMVDCGGPSEVAAIYSHVPTSHNHEEYFHIIRHYNTARLAIAGAERIIDSARNPVVNGELSETVQKALVAIASEAESGTKIESIGEATTRRLNEYEEMVKNKGKLMGLTYGFPALDEHTGGMRPGQLIVIGAPTKGGKTALALNIAQRTADAGNSVGVFSLEMSSGEMVDRLVASLTGVDISILSKNPSKEEMGKIAFGIRQVSTLPIWIRDESSINPLQIMAAARRMVATHGVKVIVFDYIQLAMPSNAKDSRERQVAEVSRCLKLVAKELGITIIALCQLNRNGTARESDAIQHDCDMFLVIRYQEAEQDSKKKQNPDECGYWLDIRLARNCSRTTFPLTFQPQYLRFEEREIKQYNQ